MGAINMNETGTRVNEDAWRRRDGGGTRERRGALNERGKRGIGRQGRRYLHRSRSRVARVRMEALPYRTVVSAGIFQPTEA